MRALIVSADNFEDSELLVPYYRLKEEGIEVDIASMRKGKIRGKRGYIDLLQFHEVIYEREPGRIFSEGVIEEAVKAREVGKIRFIGFTEHRWDDGLPAPRS